MTKPLVAAVVFLVCTEIVFSQERIFSAHQADMQLYGGTKQPSLYDESGKGIIPLQFDKSKSAGTTIFGYLPDWEYNNRGYLKYQLLTHLAAFDFTVDSMGNVSNPSYWPWTDIINTAHTNGVKIILTAVNFNPAHIRNIMTNNIAKQNFIRAVKTKIGQFSLDGVNVDFESLYSSDRGTVLNTFLKELSDSVKKTYPSSEISFAGPALTSGYSLLGLIGSVDYVFIMGYSFYGSWSSTSGACAPLYGTTYSIENTVNVQYAAALPFPSKLILGVPYYGLKWTTQNEQPHSQVIDYISSTRFSTDAVNAPFYGKLWSANMGVPWYRFQANNIWNQVWFDNDSSLGLKYELAQSKGFRGVGMWALCYDGSRQELWNEIQRRFFSPSSVRELPTTGTKNIYPNPADAYITLDTDDSEFGEYVLISTMGEELARIVQTEKSKGSVRFSTSSFAPGVYFISARTNTGYHVYRFLIAR